eukprot:TCONS_00011088-protein
MSSNIHQRLQKLTPWNIDPNQCTNASSFYQKLSEPSEKKRRLDHQVKQFNLGNGQTFNDPIAAAEYLLKREYGDTFLFHQNQHDPVLIPAEFISNQYCKKDASTTLLDFEIEKQIKRSLDNLKNKSPYFWFTTALERFIQTQNNGEINQKQFDHWILNVKVLYLVIENVPQPEDLNLLSTTSSNFITDCINELNKYAPTSNLIGILSPVKMKTVKKNILKEIENSPTNHLTLLWFFNLQISECGEKTERSFFDKIYSLQEDDILNDTVILSAVNFLIDFENKKHQEFDFLIFSWTRKLIIGIEVKRQLTDEKAFNQLQKYHSIFQNKLADQLGLGWNFFPVIYVEKELSTLPVTNHYIDSNTDIEMWLSTITNLFLENQNRQSIEDLKKVLQLIVFTIHLSKKDYPRPITSSYWVDYISDVINSLSNAHNIVFYSQKQLPVMSTNDPSCNKLFFMAGFGTGKTFLLQEKAILLSKINEFKGGIYYIVCNGKGMLFYERKLHLEKHGIHVISRTKDVLDQTNAGISHVKAIFFDEWNDELDNEDNDLMIRLLDETPICWVAPSCSYRAENNLKFISENKLKDFEIIKLDLNLRNTKEISKKAINIGEQKLFKYANGLSVPPPNFPEGPRPFYSKSIDDALFQARMISPTKGILIVSDNSQFKTNTKEKIKFFHRSMKDFSSKENPIDFLNEGNVIITSRDLISGFEWPVIIYLDEYNESEDVEHHECNIISRCTSMLFIIGENDSSDVKTYPYTEILNLVEFSVDDHVNVSNIKSFIRKCIADFLKYSTERQWLENILIILKNGFQIISLLATTAFTEDRSRTVLYLEQIIGFLLRVHLKGSENEWLSNKDVVRLVLHSLDSLDGSCNIYDESHKWFSACLNDNFLKNYTNFDFLKTMMNINPNRETKLWTDFQLKRSPEIRFSPDLIVFNISIQESFHVKVFKVFMISYIIDYFQRFQNNGLYEWTQALSLTLNHTIQQISLSNTVEFSIYKNIFQFLLTNLITNKSKAMIYVPAAMS